MTVLSWLEKIGMKGENNERKWQMDVANVTRKMDECRQMEVICLFVV